MNETTGGNIELIKVVDPTDNLRDLYKLKAGQGTKMYVYLDYLDAFSMAWSTELTVYEYNNIYVMTNEFSAHLTFNELQWPLNIANIIGVMTERLSSGNRGDFLSGGISLNDGYEPPLVVKDDQDFIRINAEYCTILFNNDDPLLHRSFSYWSHIPAIEELLEVYKTTAVDPIDDEMFIDIVNLLTSPRFGQNSPLSVGQSGLEIQ